MLIIKLGVKLVIDGEKINEMQRKSVVSIKCIMNLIKVTQNRRYKWQCGWTTQKAQIWKCNTHNIFEISTRKGSDFVCDKKGELFAQITGSKIHFFFLSFTSLMSQHDTSLISFSSSILFYLFPFSSRHLLKNWTRGGKLCLKFKS